MCGKYLTASTSDGTLVINLIEESLQKKCHSIAVTSDVRERMADGLMEAMTRYHAASATGDGSGLPDALHGRDANLEAQTMTSLQDSSIADSISLATGSSPSTSVLCTAVANVPVSGGNLASVAIQKHTGPEFESTDTLLVLPLPKKLSGSDTAIQVNSSATNPTNALRLFINKRMREEYTFEEHSNQSQPLVVDRRLDSMRVISHKRARIQSIGLKITDPAQIMKANDEDKQLKLLELEQRVKRSDFPKGLKPSF